MKAWLSPAGTSSATRERYERLASEIEPAMLTLAEVLGRLRGLTSQETIH